MYLLNSAERACGGTGSNTVYVFARDSFVQERELPIPEDTRERDSRVCAGLACAGTMFLINYGTTG